MVLQYFSYIEDKSTSNEWRIKKSQLFQLNAIAGNNSTGKSRFIKAIATLAKLISNTVGSDSINKSCRWHLFFEVQCNKKIEYILEIQTGMVVQEKLIFTKSGETLLERDRNGICTIFAVELNQKIIFGVNPTDLAAAKFRDCKQHPFLEELYQWSKTVFFVGEHLSVKSQFNSAFTVDIFRKAKEKFGKDFVQSIISDMSELDYPLAEVGIKNFSPVTYDYHQSIAKIYIKEIESCVAIDNSQMSKGMFYVLKFFIHFNYFLHCGIPACLLIDNFGTGLDYSRSSLLTKRLIKKIEGTSLQLIVTTTNRFVVDAIPIQYLSIIENGSGLFNLSNIYNSPEKFELIRLIGLNHSDLLNTY
jgi:AAA15 family ATPase/GTPase